MATVLDTYVAHTHGRDWTRDVWAEFLAFMAPHKPFNGRRGKDISRLLRNLCGHPPLAKYHSYAGNCRKHAVE